MPVIALLTVAGIAASLLQNAPTFAFERIKPQLSRISIREGAKRTFGVRGQVEFLKAAAKFVAVAIVVMVILRSEQLRVMSSIYTDPVAVPALILAARDEAARRGQRRDDRHRRGRPRLVARSAGGASCA